MSQERELKADLSVLSSSCLRASRNNLLVVDL